MTFEFDEKEDSNLESYVFQALGAASVCWSEPPSGVFDSTLAKEIGEALMWKIVADLEARMDTAVRPVVEARDELWRFVAAMAMNGDLVITQQALAEIPQIPTFERYDDPATGYIRIRLLK